MTLRLRFRAFGSFADLIDDILKLPTPFRWFREPPRALPGSAATAPACPPDARENAPAQDRNSDLLQLIQRLTSSLAGLRLAASI